MPGGVVRMGTRRPKRAILAQLGLNLPSMADSRCVSTGILRFPNSLPKSPPPPPRCQSLALLPAIRKSYLHFVVASLCVVCWLQ